MAPPLMCNSHLESYVRAVTFSASEDLESLYFGGGDLHAATLGWRFENGPHGERPRAVVYVFLNRLVPEFHAPVRALLGALGLEFLEVPTLAAIPPRPPLD